MPKIHDRKEKKRRSAKTESIINYRKKANPILARREEQTKHYEKIKNIISRIYHLTNGKMGIEYCLNKLGESLVGVEKTPSMEKNIQRLYKRCTRLSKLCETASRDFEEPRKLLDEIMSTFEKDSEICSMIGTLCGAVALETHHTVTKDKSPISLNFPYKVVIKQTPKTAATRTRVKRKAFIKPTTAIRQSVDIH